MTRVRVQLHTPAGWQRLAVGSYTLGRSDVCEVVLDSSRASRKHARVTVTEEGATLDDLGSANGTFVNGTRLTAAQALAHGDFVVIGDLGLEVAVEPLADSPDRAPGVSQSGAEAAQGPHLPPTSRVSAGEVLAAVADRAIELGNAEQAERTLEQWLTRTLGDVRAGHKREASDIVIAVRQSLHLALALKKQRWSDYALELLGSGAPAPNQATLDELSRAVAEAGASPTLLETFAERMRTLPKSAETEAATQWVGAWLAHPG